VYLVHIIAHGGITTNHKKLRAIQEWPNQIKKHEIRRFLVLYTYYIQFISSFTSIVKPPTELMEEKRSLQWTPEMEATFQSLKEALCTAPVLACLQLGEIGSSLKQT
jgi:hypothetical protein